MKKIKLEIIVGIILPVLAIIVGIFTMSPKDFSQHILDYLKVLTYYSAFILLLIIIILLVIVVIQKIKFKKMKDYIIKIEHNVKDEIFVVKNRKHELLTSRFNEEIWKAKYICGIGIANNSLTSEISKEFYRDFLLRRQGCIRLMFLDPDCEEIQKRETAEFRTKGSLSFFVKHNLEDLKKFIADCVKENPNVSKRVEVKLYKFTPHLNCMLLDDSTAFVHYYGTHSRGFDTPSLVISKESDILEFFINEFKVLWEFGEVWDFNKN